MRVNVSNVGKVQQVKPVTANLIAGGRMIEGVTLTVYGKEKDDEVQVLRRRSKQRDMAERHITLVRRRQPSA